MNICCIGGLWDLKQWIGIGLRITHKEDYHLTQRHWITRKPIKRSQTVNHEVKLYIHHRFAFTVSMAK